MNRFRNQILRNQYDQMVLKWERKHADLFRPDGEPHMGAGGGMAFWLGYQGRTIGAGFITARDKQTPNYACWRAGQDCRKIEDAKLLRQS